MLRLLRTIISPSSQICFAENVFFFFFWTPGWCFRTSRAYYAVYPLLSGACTVVVLCRVAPFLSRLFCFAQCAGGMHVYRNEAYLWID